MDYRPKVIYSQLCYYYLIKNNFILSFIKFLDFLNVYSFLLITIFETKNGYSKINEKDYFFYYISIYNLYKDQISNDNIYYRYSLLSLSYLIYIFYFIFFINLKKKDLDKNKKTIKKTINKILINFYEIFFLRFLLLFDIDTYIQTIVYIIYKDETRTSNKINVRSLFKIIFFFYSLLIIVYFILIHIKTFCVTANIKNFKDSLDNYPFNINISIHFDLCNVFIKIFICLQKNFKIYDGKYYKNYQLFFGTMSLIIYFLLFIYILYLLFYTKSDLIYFPCSFYVKFKLFLVCFTGLSMIFCLIIKKQRMNVIVFFLFLIFFSLIILFFIIYDKIIENRICNTRNIVAFLTFLICNNINKESFMINWICNHKINCNIINCYICDCINNLLENKIDLDFIKFFNIFLNARIKELNKTKKNIKKIENIYLDLLQIFAKYISCETQTSNFFLLIYSKLKKYKKTNDSIYFDLITIFKQSLNEKKKFYSNLKYIKNINFISENYENFFKLLDKYFGDEFKTPENYILLSEKIYEFVNNNNLKKKLKKIIKNYSYENIIFRFIYEYLTQKSLVINEDFIDFGIYEDFLIEHYNNDQFLLLQFSLNTKNFIIIKSSKQFIQFINYNFEYLFPNYLQKICNEKMYNYIINNTFEDKKNFFQFPILDPKYKDDAYLKYFEMKFVTYPTFKYGELYLYCIFNIFNKEVLLYKKEVCKLKKKLVSFSYKMNKFLKITPNLISLLNNLKQTFSFFDIFKNISSKKSVDDKIKFQINFDVYIKLLEFYLTKFNDINCNKDEIINKLIQNKNSITNQIFYVMKKIIIGKQNEKEKYILYLININSIEAFQKKTTIPRELLYITEKNNNENFQSTLLGNESSNNGLSNSKNNILFNIIKLDNNKNKIIHLKRYKKFKNLHLLITIIQIIISIVNILLIFFHIIEDNNFNNYYKFLDKFFFFKKELHTEILRMTSNLCYEITIDNITKIDCKFKILSENYLKVLSINVDENLYMNEIVYQKFIKEIDECTLRYQLFIKNLYTLSKSKINEIENKYINIYFISSKNDEIYNNNLTKNKITYTDYIHLYLGFLTQLIGREKLQESPIKFFTINENFSVQNLEFSELSIDQKLIYQLIINIPFTQKIINDISKIIFKWFDDSRTIMDKTLNIFSIIILILNIFVMILYFIYVNIYVILFNEKFNFFIEKFKNKEFVYYFNSKINFLRLLVQLYEKNPINEINNITKNKREYDKYLEKKRIKNSKEFEETEFIKDDLKKTYKNKNIFIYYYLILLLYYFIDFIIFIILYFVLIKNNHELKILIEYHNLSIDLDSSIMNNFIDLQYIIYTNITENYIGYLIEGNNISNYLTNNLENMISIINKIQEMETNNNYINEITKDFLNTTCENVFDLIKDENSQKNKDYYITICKNFGLFEFGNQYFLYKSISYYLFLLFNSIHQIPYEKKYNSINYFDLFGIYNLLLFLVDILRTYQNEIIITDLIDNILSIHRIYIIICLILNLIVELIIAIILYFSICKKLINVYDKINLLNEFCN